METINILFRCDASPEIGLGHVTRCLALADELRSVHGCGISFAMRKGPLGFNLVKERGHEVIVSREEDREFDYGIWLLDCVERINAQVIVFDVRDGLKREVVKKLRDSSRLIIDIDDPEDKRLEADLVFYPPVPQVQRMSWEGFSGELFAGWEWVLLRKEFSEIPEIKKGRHHFQILVTMGGSDPEGMTLAAVEALQGLDKDFKAVIALGRGFQYEDELDQLLSQDSRKFFEVRKDVVDMAALMYESDLAIASFGVTAYELAAMGVPALYLCLTEDHHESASIFVKGGVAVSQRFTPATKSVLADTVKNFMSDILHHSRMSRLAREKVDGKGVERVARLILLNLSKNRRF
ncbi:MAG: UDP-2,4-diacetamido-2,4,6-trideoxy-beta-L-altropyranose hydrolase [Candidatus Omnitrophota bacterium]